MDKKPLEGTNVKVFKASTGIDFCKMTHISDITKTFEKDG